MKVSIIICCFDEEPIIKNSWNRLRQALESFPTKEFEIVFVNDGSTDNTLGLIRGIMETDKRIKAVTYPDNKGYGYALREGLSHATGDIVITMDADLAMNPKEVIASCLNWMNNKDMVICSRYKGIKPDYPLMRRIASWGYRKLNKLLFRIPFNDTQSGFIGFKKEILKGIELKSDDFSILMELIAKVYRNKWMIAEIPFKFIHSTASGQTSIWKSGPKMLKNTLKVWRGLKNESA